MKKSLLILAASITAAVSMNVSAATTGNITFEGSVINGTCQIATASDNQIIILPQVVASDFTAANQASGTSTVVPFQITLTGCDASTPGTVAVAFDFQPAAGYDNILENTGSATGVGVQLHSATGKTIAMTTADHYTTPKPLATGDVGFDLDARYVSTAATVTAGSVNASAIIGVVYP